jgi:hypothetical protein
MTFVNLEWTVEQRTDRKAVIHMSKSSVLRVSRGLQFTSLEEHKSESTLMWNVAMLESMCMSFRPGAVDMAAAFRDIWSLVG